MPLDHDQKNSPFGHVTSIAQDQRGLPLLDQLFGIRQNRTAVVTEPDKSPALAQLRSRRRVASYSDHGAPSRERL